MHASDLLPAAMIRRQWYVTHNSFNNERHDRSIHAEDESIVLVVVWSKICSESILRDSCLWIIIELGFLTIRKAEGRNMPAVTPEVEEQSLDFSTTLVGR